MNDPGTTGFEVWLRAWPRKSPGPRMSESPAWWGNRAGLLKIPAVAARDRHRHTLASGAPRQIGKICSGLATPAEMHPLDARYDKGMPRPAGSQGGASTYGTYGQINSGKYAPRLARA